MNRKFLFAGAGVALLLAFFAAVLVYTNQKNQQAAQTAASNNSSLARPYSPTLGKPDAKVHIVEFLDPACETCRAFYPHVKRILAAEPDRVRLTLRHVPLHPGSGEVVKMLEASKYQGKYWQVLEALLSAQPQWVIRHVAQPDEAWRVLQGLGLDLERLKADMNTPQVLQHVEQDSQDARALEVRQTPEYFVNGRPLPSFGLEQLQQMVETALRGAY